MKLAGPVELSSASEIMFNATIFELALQLSNVREFFELLSIATPARVEGENVAKRLTLLGATNTARRLEKAG